MTLSTLNEFNSLMLDTVILNTGERRLKTAPPDDMTSTHLVSVSFLRELMIFPPLPMMRPMKLLCARIFRTMSLNEHDTVHPRHSPALRLLRLILVLSIVVHDAKNFSACLHAMIWLTADDDHSFLSIRRFALVHIDSDGKGKRFDRRHETDIEYRSLGMRRLFDLLDRRTLLANDRAHGFAGN